MDKRFCKQCWKELLLKDFKSIYIWKHRVFCDQKCNTEFKKTVRHSDEYKKKMSERLKWHQVSDETRRKISKANKWKKWSKEAKIKFWEKYKWRYSWDKHPNWKWWKTRPLDNIRNTKEYKTWKRLVFERDNYTCQKTWKTLVELNAHHISNLSVDIDKRFCVDNWITLCEKAHREFHKKYGYRNNNLEQIKEFLSK